jgi:hypothetical protein
LFVLELVILYFQKIIYLFLFMLNI